MDVVSIQPLKPRHTRATLMDSSLHGISVFAECAPISIPSHLSSGMFQRNSREFSRQQLQKWLFKAPQPCDRDCVSF